MPDILQETEIRFKTTTDTDGAEQTANALDKVRTAAGYSSDEAKENTASTDKMGQASIGAAHLIHGLEMAAHGSARGMFSAATGARHLLDALGLSALSPIVLAIAGIGVAVASLAKMVEGAKKETDDFNKSSADLAEQTREMKLARFDQVIDQYKQMADEIERALSAQESLNAKRLEMMSAKMQTQLAQDKLEEAKELARTAPNDELGSERIKAKHAASREQIELGGREAEGKQKISDITDAQRDLKREQALRQKEADTAQGKLAQAQAQLDQAKNNAQALTSLNSQYDAVKNNGDMTDPKIIDQLFQLPKQIKAAQQVFDSGPKVNDAQKAYDAAKKEAEAPQKSLVEVQAKMAEKQADLEIEKQKLRTTAADRTASGVTAEDQSQRLYQKQAEKDEEAARAAQLAPLEQRMSHGKEYKARIEGTEKMLEDPATTKAQHDQIMKDLAAAHIYNAQKGEVLKQVIAYLSEISKSEAVLQAQIEVLKDHQRNAVHQ